MNIKESYRILRLKEGAGLEEVKRSFRAMAFKLHPDLNPDDPHAARHFQRVNEAYVLLKQHLESDLSASAGKQTSGNFGAPGPSASRKPPPPPGGGNRASTPPPGSASSSGTRQKAHRQYTANANARHAPGREDVLNEILKDPFARQVFEDIYSQIRRSGGKGIVKAKRPPTKKKLHLQWGEKGLDLDLSEGVWNGAKAVFRSWLDERQTVFMPAGQLRPGTRVRLQVKQGWSGKKVSVEVTLPRDYIPGRAVRLKGLGRKIGPFVGDLYVHLMVR